MISNTFKITYRHHLCYVGYVGKRAFKINSNLPVNYIRSLIDLFRVLINSLSLKRPFF